MTSTLDVTEALDIRVWRCSSDLWCLSCETTAEGEPNHGVYLSGASRPEVLRALAAKLNTPEEES